MRRTNLLFAVFSISMLLPSCASELSAPSDVGDTDEVTKAVESLIGSVVQTDLWGLPRFGTGCSSIALSDYWVLTARHCSISPYLRQGIVSMLDGRSLQISHGYQHETADAGLLRLSRSTRGGFIYKNGLFPGTLTELQDKAVTCFGWGPTDSSGTGNGVLRTATGTIVEVKYDPTWRTDVFRVSPAFGFPGDSGGPCLVQHNGGTYVAGVYSGGGWYSSVTQYRDWAEHLMTGELAPTEAVVAEHSGYNGRASILGPNSFPNPLNMGIPNDSVSSIRVGSMVKLTLFENDNYGGSSYSSPYGTDSIDLYYNGFNDKASSARVEVRPSTGCPNPGAKEVTLWADANYQGACDVLRPNSMDEMSALNVGDGLSSVKVGSDVRITLYESVGFTGFYSIISSDVSDLTSLSFNDRTRSARINGRGCTPPGPTGAVVWDDVEYTGQCRQYGLTSAIFSGAFPNNAISSIQVGTNTRVALYDGEYTGLGRFLRTDHPYLPALGFNDTASSIRVKKQTLCSNPGPGEVVLWVDAGYTGPCVTLKKGQYCFPMNSEFDIGNDVLTSFKIGTGASLTIYDNDYCRSDDTKKTFYQDVSTLATEFKPDNRTWNDAVSSVTVQ